VDKADQQLDTESVGQYQRFGTATRPGSIEHIAQAAMACAKRSALTAMIKKSPIRCFLSQFLYYLDMWRSSTKDQTRRNSF
jgi:hypothetical protein